MENILKQVEIGGITQPSAWSALKTAPGEYGSARKVG